MTGPRKNIVVLTGAGISAESGIRTFRAADGLWEDHAIEDVASPEGFGRNPRLVQEFYNQRRKQLKDENVKPNLAHFALTELEKNWGGEFLLVTQNVDDLHERAGSKNLIHMHGELLKVRCLQSQKIHSWTEDVQGRTLCPCCSRGENLRPHIVWFGERPLRMPEIADALQNCDIFISVGTSGNVYPAAGFVREVPLGSKKIEINLESTTLTDIFDEHLIGPATVKVPGVVKRLLEAPF
jgi:NAD-dependent deacetylase